MATSFLDKEFKLTVYRIIQELVQNIVKHAHATRTLVQISYEEKLLTITVENNGTGIPSHNATDGMGLTNIKTRVKALNGQIDIQTGEEGTTVYLEFTV